MPIRKYVSSATFGPETIKDMTTAFERIRTILKLEDPDDPLVEVVAKKVISLAEAGMTKSIIEMLRQDEVKCDFASASAR